MTLNRKGGHPMPKVKSASIEHKPGNTPVLKAPKDYLPAGAKACWLRLEEGLDAGKMMFFYDVVIGNGAPQATILFVHGNPECSYTYRQTIEQLASQTSKAFRIIAMDHIGFGLSDQASFEMVDFHHANNLKHLIALLDLKDITLVIHDWGGAIGVGALIDTPELVSNLVLVNTTVFPYPSKGVNFNNFPYPGPLAWNQLGNNMPWKAWRHIPPLVMFSPSGKVAFARHVLNFTFRSMTGQLTEEERMYRDMFKTRANAKSSMRNVKQTKVWGHGYQYFDETEGWQDNHDFYQNIQDKIGKCWGPKGQNINVRSFWGEWCPLAKDLVQQQWLEALPQLDGHVQRFANRGHFLEEHEPEAIAKGIVDAAGLVLAS